MTDVPVPSHVEPYVEVLGVPLTVEFLLTFGGAEQYFAADPKSRSPVASLVGHEKARALAARLGPGHVRVPTARPFVARFLKASGASGAAIARRLHVTETTVRSYLREPETPQLDLFG